MPPLKSLPIWRSVEEHTQTPEACRELGAEAVEIDARNELRPEEMSQTGVRQLRKMLEDLNLRVSAIGLFLLIPIKIYTGWAARGKVPDLPEALGSARKIHFNAGIDILLLLFFLLHGFYGLRVILIDVGAIREEKFFWRTLVVAMGIFGVAVWFVYLHGE